MKNHSPATIHNQGLVAWADHGYGNYGPISKPKPIAKKHSKAAIEKMVALENAANAHAIKKIYDDQKPKEKWGAPAGKVESATVDAMPANEKLVSKSAVEEIALKQLPKKEVYGYPPDGSATIQPRLSEKSIVSRSATDDARMVSNPDVDKALKIIQKLVVSDSEKEKIITEALSTDEGRRALAKAMVEPIRGTLDYQKADRFFSPTHSAQTWDTSKVKGFPGHIGIPGPKGFAGPKGPRKAKPATKTPIITPDKQKSMSAVDGVKGDLQAAIVDMQKQLAAVACDPNLTIRSHHWAKHWMKLEADPIVRKWL